MNNLFTSIFATGMTPLNFLICIFASFAIGTILSLLTSIRNTASKSFKITIAILPAIIALVISMVNGNLGAGIAVAGAFSLIRFRSVPGSAKEICIIFLATAAGLALGMGYIAYALIFTVICSVFFIILNVSKFGEVSANTHNVLLRITIPEDLNYIDAFNDLFDEYTYGATLIKTKLINLGSMFRLTYRTKLKDPSKQKEFADKLRERNGNLEIMFTLDGLGENEL